MFFRRRRRADARGREHHLEAMQRLLERYEQLQSRVVEIQADLRARDAVEALLRQRLGRSETELAAARARIESLVETVARLTAELERRPLLQDELAPLWAHLAGQRELLSGLAQRVERTIRVRQQPLRQLPAPPPEPAAAAHLLLLTTPAGYELLERAGAPPGAGAAVALDDGRRAEVVKVGRSPLPGDDRRCAFAQLLPGFEPPANVVAIGHG